MSSTFQNKVALVTGGASGIGRALCDELAGRGALTLVTDINLEGAEKVAAGIRQKGGQASASRVDVTSAEEVTQAIEAAAAAHGRLDYVFNNAGIGVGGEVRDLTLDHWRKAIDIN